MNKEGAIVTGGTAGIGKEVCQHQAHTGTQVVIAGRNNDRGQQLAKQIQDLGGAALFVATDVGVEKR